MIKLRDILNEIKVNNPIAQYNLYKRALEVVKTFEDDDQLQSFMDEFPNGKDLNKETWIDWNDGYFTDNEGWNDANWQFILTNDESSYDHLI
jgi:hypothetical protein